MLRSSAGFGRLGARVGLAYRAGVVGSTLSDVLAGDSAPVLDRWGRPALEADENRVRLERDLRAPRGPRRHYCLSAAGYGAALPWLRVHGRLSEFGSGQKQALLERC